MTISKDFVGRTHILLLDLRGILRSLRSSPRQWLRIYTFTYAYITTFTHYHFTTMAITTIPYYHVRNRDADEQRLASDKRWKDPRTDRFLSLSLFISLLNEASTVQEPLDVGQTVAFLAADG